MLEQSTILHEQLVVSIYIPQRCQYNKLVPNQTGTPSKFQLQEIHVV